MNRVLIIALLALITGCKGVDATMSDKPSPASSVTNETVARVHWLGKSKISPGTNAAGLMQIWNLPETAKLEAEFLDKLSLAPWQLLREQTNHVAAAALRPLLNDFVQEESYLEIRGPVNSTNRSGEMVLAIHLKDDRANLWKTNLASVLESLTGIKPLVPEHGLPRRSEAKAGTQSMDRLWSLKKHHAPNLIELARVGEWTLLGAAQDHNALLDEMCARIQRHRIPFTAPATNFWLDANIDLPRTVAAVGRHLDLPANFPKISLTMIGDGKNVQTRGQLNFPNPLQVALDKWKIPTNFVDADLSSFTAIRGCESLLACTTWDQFETNPPPNQFYLWAGGGVPMQSYFAAPLPDASNTVSRLSESILKTAEPWFAAHDLARFQRAKKISGLEWKGNPYVSPFLKSTNIADDGYLLGGLFPLATPDDSLSQQLIQTVQDSTNLVYYDWELTGTRIGQLTYLAQLLRVTLGRPQLSSESVAMMWLRAISEKLGPSRSEIVLTSPQQLSFVRASSVPFTAFELQLLVEWMESPEFPALFRAGIDANSP